MSQTFDVTKPISGTTKFSQLYQIIRDHDQANQSSFSGTTAPTPAVIGQLWEDTANDKLYLYTNASGWSEVAVGNTGLGQEIIVARGDHTQLDNRLDVALNEDGTLKASTSLNPSEWFDVTVASGYVSTTSFRAYGADYTTVYHPLRRLKVNRAAGTYYTEVASSSYSSPNTTVVTRDAVISTDLEYVSHSIVDVRKASAGDGAVSYEMVANKNVASPTSEYTVLVGDSVVMASGTFTVHGIAGGTFGPGRPLLIINIGTGSITYDPGAYSVNGSTTDLVLLAGQSLLIYPDGDNWRRADRPLVEGWSFPTLSSNWVEDKTVAYMKDPFGFVHLKGYIYSSGGGVSPIFTLPSGYLPEQDSYFYVNMDNSTEVINPLSINTSGEVIPNAVSSGDSVFFNGITFKAAA